jgi:hypothetical protein
LFSTLTKMKNRHSIRVGADLRRERYSTLSSGYTAGTFTFGSTWTERHRRPSEEMAFDSQNLVGPVG